MELFFLLAILALSCLSNGAVLAFTPSPFSHRNTRIGATALNANKVGLIYASQFGNCEIVAKHVSEASGLPMKNIDEATDEDFLSFDSLIVGAPTYGTGMVSERSGTEWDTWLYSTLPNLDVKGKNIAVFGVGDQDLYSEYYCDAVGEIYDLFEKAGCKMMGSTSTDGYDHTESEAERDGKFIGLCCDEDNQPDLSEDRAQAWIGQLKEEGFF